jgi:secreted trypsin-like serine protease
MRKILSFAGGVAALLVLQISPTHAITYGQPDNGAHPNVGALIAEWREPGVKEQLCSGTLIDEDVFLTAAHCTAFLASMDPPITEVWVSFADDVAPVVESTLIEGTYVTNPEYSQRQSDPRDIAVVLLDVDQSMAPAALPPIGRFDQMKAAGTLKSTKFTAVGYGVQERQTGGGPPTFPEDGLRRRAVQSFNSLNKNWLRLSQNPAHGDGGACYGDSGGPNFLGAGASETNIIASTTITGDIACGSTNVTLRLDTASAHGFIGDFLD